MHKALCTHLRYAQGCVRTKSMPPFNKVYRIMIWFQFLNKIQPYNFELAVNHYFHLLNRAGVWNERNGVTFFYSLTFSSIQAETVHGTIDRLAFDKSLQRAQRQKNIVPKFFNPNFWLSNTIMPLLYLREKELLTEVHTERTPIPLF